MSYQTVSKTHLRDLLDQQYSAFVKSGHEVLVYAEDAATRDALKKSMKTGKRPPNLKQQEWEEYLAAVESGEYKPLSHEPMQERQKHSYR